MDSEYAKLDRFDIQRTLRRGPILTGYTTHNV